MKYFKGQKVPSKKVETVSRFFVAKDRQTAIKLANGVRDGRLSEREACKTVGEAQVHKNAMRRYSRGVLRIFQMKV